RGDIAIELVLPEHTTLGERDGDIARRQRGARREQDRDILNVQFCGALDGTRRGLADALQIELIGIAGANQLNALRPRRLGAVQQGLRAETTGEIAGASQRPDDAAARRVEITHPTVLETFALEEWHAEKRRAGLRRRASLQADLHRQFSPRNSPGLPRRKS